MFLIYDLIYFFAALIYVPVLILKRKWHREMWHRLGSFPDETRTAIRQHKKNVWVHAVSVGEVLAVFRLIQNIEHSFPDYRIVLSTVTQAGYQLAKSRLGRDHAVIYAPLDFSFAVRRYIKLINPKVYIAAETEIWPNLFSFLSKNQIPILLVNGRLSEKSFNGYRKIRFLISKILNHVTLFCMQTQKDADKIMALGVSPKKVKVVGNIKFDDLPERPEFSVREFGFGPQEPIWIAGSTHPGEEEIILRIYRKLLVEFPRLQLVLAPRHVDRTGEVEKLITDAGFSSLRFSQIHSCANHQNTVILVDTIGHLRSLYSLAKIVFIGKSLTARGGQNIIEPAYFGKPIFVGPYMDNFNDIRNAFLEDEAIVSVHNEHELLEEMSKWLHHPKDLERLGEKARAVVEKYRGAGEKVMENIATFLAEKR